jgi:nucleotide-binding universal stress UspA family protein
MAEAIVVGVDGSEESRDAALLGRHLATSSGAELHLITVAFGVMIDALAARTGVDPTKLDQALVQRALQTARANLAVEFDSADLERCLVARMGRPEHALAEYGKEHSAGLFVLGVHRSPPPATWMWQGTAHHLLRVTDVPVVIARPGGSEIQRVLVAVEASAAAASVIETGAALAETLGASVEVIHVVPDPPHLELVPGFDAGAWVKAAEDLAVEELGPLVSQGTPVSYVHGNVVSTLRHAAAEGPPTLLVVGGQGRGRIHRLLLGSTTEALIAQSPSSLAVVPTP